VAADDDSFFRCAGKRCKKISSGIDFVGEAYGVELFDEPFAGGAPDGAPGEALRAIGRGGERGEFAEFRDDALCGIGGSGDGLRRAHERISV